MNFIKDFTVVPVLWLLFGLELFHCPGATKAFEWVDHNFGYV